MKKKFFGLIFFLIHTHQPTNKDKHQNMNFTNKKKFCVKKNSSKGVSIDE